MQFYDVSRTQRGSKAVPVPLTHEGEQPMLPLLRLHQALEQVGAYDEIKPRHSRVLKTWLSTELPMGDLRDSAEVKTVRGVHHIIHRSLEKVWEHLPQEVREAYKSPKEAIRQKAGTLSAISRSRLKEKVIDKETGTFKSEHHTHLSEAANRRWAQHREQKLQQSPAQEPHTIIDLTHPLQER